MSIGAAWMVLVHALFSPSAAQETDLPPYPWDLETCLVVARSGNLDLAQVAASAEAQEGRHSQSLGAYLPSMNTSVSFSRNETAEGTIFVDESGRLINQKVSERYQVSSSVRQSLIDLGAIYTIRGSAQRLQEARQRVESAKEQLELDVTQNFYALLKAAKQARVALEAVDLGKEQLRRTESLQELGSVPRADVLQSRVALARNELDLISARHTVRQGQSNLALVLGLSDDREIAIDTTVVLPPLDIPWGEEQLWEWASRDRADLQEVRLAHRASRTSAQAARLDRYPTLGLNAFYSKTADRSGDAFELKSGDARWGMTVALSMNLNPIDQLLIGSTKGGVEAAEWTARQERRRLQKKELEVRLDIRNAINAWEEARERHSMSQENLRYAEENLRLQKALYEGGGGTILEWNNAQVELTRARSDLLAAQVDLLSAEASLARSVGRELR